MVTKEKIEEGQIRRGRVLYRESVTPNPKEISNIGGDIIVTRFAVTDKLNPSTMREMHIDNIQSAVAPHIIFSDVKGVPVERGAATTGVYSVNRGFIGVLNMYKVATVISPEFISPKWFRDHLDKVIEQSKGKFVEVPEPIYEEI